MKISLSYGCRMKKGALFVILVVFAVGVGFWIQRTYQPERESIPNPMIVGTSADFKPLAFQENNEIKGFDVDLIKEVAQRLGVNYTLKDMPFDFLLAQLQFNTIHVVAAGLSKTPERAEHVYFSDPYLIEDPLVVLVPAEKQGQVQSFDDLYNTTVIVNQGYTAEEYMKHFDTIELLRLSNVPEAIMALDAGKASAFVTGAHTLQPIINEYGNDKFHTFRINDTTETLSLGISKQYPKLRDEINGILQQLHKEGIISQLKEKWQIA